MKEPHSKKLPTDPPKKTNKNPYANQDQEKPLKTERRGEKALIGKERKGEKVQTEIKLSMHAWRNKKGQKG